MNTSKSVERELANIGDGAAATLAVEDSPRHLTCDIVERNSLAVSFNQLRLATDGIGDR